MKLVEGMYVRTNEGISKIYAIAPKEENYYKLILDKNETLSIGDSEFVLNASYNIIDLIEVGDYVDGEKVQFITEKGEMLGGYDLTIVRKNNNIKSIVTKEQFKAMEYKVD